MSKSKFLCTGGWVHAALALSVDGTPSLVPFCPLFCRKCGGFQLQQHRKKNPVVIYGDSNAVVSLRWGLGGLRHFRGAHRPFRRSS